ncbi:nitroreductase family protein [Enterococcus mediterraneensis]|uniref:nitroreductase family protein n=1 Tax=Enterococcus mediterraneensis TaxID=2364791 RepID=UPI000F04D59C|nr:nitroreductase family protein [Enterococcus mediterraneensis]
MKKQLKKILPNQIISLFRIWRDEIKLFVLFRHDLSRFRNGFTTNLKKASMEQLDARLLFYAHALEKGFSHSNFRDNFGIQTLNNLSNSINIYNSKGFNKKRIKYQIALSALGNYINIHEERNSNVQFLSNIFKDEILNEAKKADLKLSGFFTVERTNVQNNMNKNFKEIAENRRSIRDYDDSPVNIDKVREALQIALKTPSVCNRQPARVYMISNPEKIKDILKIQGGFNGFDSPPLLLLITSSNSSFIDPTERNEGYIDGGLFGMSVLYGLEYNGLAACALNAMLNDKKEKEIRKLLNIPDDEVLIMFVSVGNLPQKVKAPRSYRESLESMVREIV